MYDEYMQNLMGIDYYPYSNTYESFERNPQYFNQVDDYEQYDFFYNQNMPYTYQHRNSFVKDAIADLEDLYPEIYKIVYPMVKKAIDRNTKPINNDLLENLANDIYHHLEADNIINIDVNINSKNSVDASDSNSENRESRNRNNPVMDLIKILLIRELVGKPGFWRPRPPRPIPHRPPFPPRHGMSENMSSSPTRPRF